MRIEFGVRGHSSSEDGGEMTIYRSMRVMDKHAFWILKSFAPAVCALVSTPRRAAKKSQLAVGLRYSPAEAGRSSRRR